MDFNSLLYFLDTTRSPRAGEQNGRGILLINCHMLTISIFFLFIEYHFVSRADMEKMIALGEFLESTEFSSNLYGTRFSNK